MESIPRIFSGCRRREREKLRLAMTPETYSEKFNVHVYLQDIVKIILDRREEKPIDLLHEYISVALKGEHVLLRDYSFISATQYNKACFLIQMKKIFHGSPHYKVVSAQDYHQCLCLLCTDFSREVIAEIAKVLPVHSSYSDTSSIEFHSSLASVPELFYKFDIEEIRKALNLFFYFDEFMEKAKGVFKDLGSGEFKPEEQVMVSLVFTGIKGVYERNKNSSFLFPYFGTVIESLLLKAQHKVKFEAHQVYTVPEIQSLLHGAGTISFKEFSSLLMNHPQIEQEILKETEIKQPKEEELQRLATEDSPTRSPTVPQPARKPKPKKKK